MSKIAPVHPGEVLIEDFMKPRGLTAHRLALELHVPANRITAIVAGTRSITADTALRLGRYFDTSAEIWMRLQAQYDLEVAKDELGKTIENEVRSHAAIA